MIVAKLMLVISCVGILVACAYGFGKNQAKMEVLDYLAKCGRRPGAKMSAQEFLDGLVKIVEGI